MKLITLLATVLITFSLAFGISMALDIVWVKTEFVRRAMVYGIIGIVLLVGYLVFREILKND